MNTSVNGVEEIESIDLGSIKNLKNKLNELDLKWVEKLADKWYMAEYGISQEEYDKIKDELADVLNKLKKKIRNIVAGIVIHNTLRRSFLIYGDALLKELMKEHGQALSIAKKHKS